MGITRDNKIDFEDYLRNSENFDDFYRQADTDIAEHLLQTSGGKESLADEIKDYALELYNEYINSTIPF